LRVNIKTKKGDVKSISAVDLPAALKGGATVVDKDFKKDDLINTMTKKQAKFIKQNPSANKKAEKKSDK